MKYLKNSFSTFSSSANATAISGSGRQVGDAQNPSDTMATS